MIKTCIQVTTWYYTHLLTMIQRCVVALNRGTNLFSVIFIPPFINNCPWNHEVLFGSWNASSVGMCLWKNHGCNFCNSLDRAFMFQMCIPCEELSLHILVVNFMPPEWKSGASSFSSCDSVAKKLNIGHNFWTVIKKTSYLSCILS